MNISEEAATSIFRIETENRCTNFLRTFGIHLKKYIMSQLGEPKTEFFFSWKSQILYLLFIYLLCVYVPLYLSIYPSTYLLSSNLLIYPFIYLRIYLSGYPNICIQAYLFTYLFIYLYNFFNDTISNSKWVASIWNIIFIILSLQQQICIHTNLI
jgi:hypothetical protein